jgi:hypothetical protein
MKVAIRNPSKYIIINTFEQDVVINNTVSAEREENVINEQLHNYRTVDLPVVIYGRNSCDLSVEQKQTQLASLGINEIYVYVGGLFEWLLLQDVYGTDEFPTVNRIAVDILRYRPKLSTAFCL